MPETTAVPPAREEDLTRDEAHERSLLLSVDRYVVDLDLTGLAEGGEFRSRTTITFCCHRPGVDSWVDLVATSVTMIRLNGVELDPAAVVTPGRIVLHDLRAENELVVEATHHESGRNHGLRRSVDPDDGAAYAWTHFETFHARRVFACFDQPDLKATFGINVRTPHEWTCVSNAPVAQVCEDPVERRWKFADSPVMSTYIVAVCAGPFYRVSRDHHGVELGVHTRRTLAGVLDAQAETLLDVAAGGLDFFAEAFGVPYPIAKLDQVFLLDFPAAMENFGCITYSDNSLYREQPTPAQLQRRGQVQLHEIGHMWFGDLVTMPWWDGLWLKEAFANLASSLAAPAVLGATDLRASFAINTATLAYSADESPATHPVQVPVPDLATAESIFDAITYHKGFAVVRQLVAWLGEDTFLAGVRTYFDRHAWGTATLDDLVDALELASGEDLGAWSAAWLHQSGVDTMSLRVQRSGSPDQRVSLLVAGSSAASRPHRVAIGHYRRQADGRLARTARFDVAVTTEHVDVTGIPALEADDVLLLNDDDLTFAKARPDDRSLVNLLDAGHTLPSAVSRAVSLRTVCDLVLDGELALSRAFPHLAALLRAEHAPSLVSLLATRVQSLVHDAASRCLLADFEDELAAACFDGATDAGDDTHRWLAFALGAAANATTPEQHAAMEAMLTEAPTQHRGLRWTALTRRLAVGAAGDVEVAAELAAHERENGPDARIRAQVARAARGTERAKEEALRSLFETDGVPTPWLGDFGSALWQRGQDELLRPYASRYVDGLDELTAQHGRSGVGRLVRATFPRSGLDHQLLDGAEAAAHRPSLPPAVAAAVLNHVHAARRGLLARTRR